MTSIEEFLRKFNEAFIQNDINYIVDSTTPDIIWTMVGDKTIRGRENLAVAMNEMKNTSGLEIIVDAMIINGDNAAVDGRMSYEDKEGNRKTYGFCDIYKFRGEDGLKISELRSYVIAVNMLNE